MNDTNKIDEMTFISTVVLYLGYILFFQLLYRKYSTPIRQSL